MNPCIHVHILHFFPFDVVNVKQSEVKKSKNDDFTVIERRKVNTHMGVLYTKSGTNPDLQRRKRQRGSNGAMHGEA